MKRLKKDFYLFLMIGIGVIYLNFVDGWQVYAEPLEKLKSLYISEAESQQTLSDGILAQGEPGQENQEGSADEGTEVADAENTEATVGTDDGEGQEEAVPAEGLSTVSGGDDIDFSNDGEPVYMTVEDDYFADAVFIGDSRTVGLYEYGGLEEITTFYASKGLTIYRIFDAEIVEVPGQRQKQTIEEALQQNTFKKIYLMVGINEMGTGTVESFADAYKDVVDHLLELQPDAILYIQGILKVSTDRSEKGDYINNEGIVARNEALSQLADNRRIFYLDANPLICDETGGMEPSYTFDGVHLKAQYIDIWKEYLKSHAIKLEQEDGGAIFT